MRKLLGKATVGLNFWAQRICNRLFSWGVAGSFAAFGERSLISLPARLHRVEGVSIGARVFFGDGCWIQTLPGEHCEHPRIEIGDGVSVSGTCVLSAALEVVLEDHVLLARNVYISDHIHGYADTSRPVMHQGVDKVAAVRIKSGAWLGQNAVVCPGVTIGRGAVVGAGSVVTEDLPDYSVSVGAPARVVKRFGDAGMS